MPSQRPRHTLRFSPKLEDEIDQVAHRLGMSTSKLVNLAVEQFLERHHEQQIQNVRIEAIEKERSDKEREGIDVLRAMAEAASLRTRHRRHTTGDLLLDLRELTDGWIKIEWPDTNITWPDLYWDDGRLREVFARVRQAVVSQDRKRIARLAERHAIVRLALEYDQIESKRDRAWRCLGEATRAWYEDKYYTDDEDDDDWEDD